MRWGEVRVGSAALLRPRVCEDDCWGEDEKYGWRQVSGFDQKGFGSSVLIRAF